MREQCVRAGASECTVRRLVNCTSVFVQSPTCVSSCSHTDHVKVKSAVLTHRWDFRASLSPLPLPLILCRLPLCLHTQFSQAVLIHQIWHAHSSCARQEQPGHTRCLIFKLQLCVSVCSRRQETRISSKPAKKHKKTNGSHYFTSNLIGRLVNTQTLCLSFDLYICSTHNLGHLLQQEGDDSNGRNRDII